MRRSWSLLRDPNKYGRAMSAIGVRSTSCRSRRMSTGTSTSGSGGGRSSCYSLALSVHFYHPALGMKSQEILSRATAFLLSVDPVGGAAKAVVSPYDHLQTSEEERALKVLQQDYSADPAGGPPRDAKDLGWLEFCPKRNRPRAHIVAASHVLSPWSWNKYYPQEWLTQIKQEHVSYSLQIFHNHHNNNHNDLTDRKPLAQFACNPYPIHHPEGADLAVVHLKQEETALKHMEQLGVQIMHLTSDDTIYQRNQQVTFQGYQIAEQEEGAAADIPKNDNNNNNTMEPPSTIITDDNDDERVFIPFQETGNLIFASPTRFLAKTERTLPEGLCGGPVLLTIDENNNNNNENTTTATTNGTTMTTTVCGVIEGIVPVDHEDKKLAGAAAFLPSIQVQNFIEYAEKEMLKQIVPETLFQKIVNIKEGKGLDGNVHNDDQQDAAQTKQDLDASLKQILKSINTSYTPEQANAILSTIEREKQEIMDILLREGGDVDETITKVRKKTRQRQREIIEQINNMQEAEIISSDQDNEHEMDSSKNTSQKK